MSLLSCSSLLIFFFCFVVIRKQGVFGGSNRDNGSVCFSDEQCESNVCCPNVFLPSALGEIGRCVTCCTSRDCTPRIEQPPAGEWGKPFCIDDKCEAYKNGISSQIPKDGYPIWLPSETLDDAKGFHKLNMPRIVHSDTPKPLFEQVWYFDFNNQDPSFNKDEIVYNGTHINIPTWSMMHAGYSRSFHSYNEHETGIVTLSMGPNEVSLVTDYPKSIWVEKYHTLTYDGKKDTARGDYIKLLSDEGMKKKWSKRSWLKRVVPQTIAMAVRLVPFFEIEAGIDKALTWQIRRYTNSYATEEIGTLNPSSSSSWASHSEKAKTAIDLAADVNFEREFKKSEQHCKHIEEGNGVDANDNYITLPLGRPVTTMSGESVQSPVYYLGVIAGHMTAYYDKDKNVLQLFYQGYSQSRQYADVKFPGPYPSGIYVSPVAEGSDYAVDPDRDGRTDKFLKLEQPPDDTTQRLPFWTPDVEFTIWRRHRSETCDSAAENDSFWEKIDLWKAFDNIYDLLLQSKRLMKGTVAGMPCANNWMRNDYGRGTNGVGILEIATWIHLLTEVQDDRTKEIGTADWWDSWECFYHKKDPALCKEE